MQFLKFVYTDAIDDTAFRTVSQLLPLAEKYNVKKLSNECGQRMLKVGENGFPEKKIESKRFF